MSSNPEWVYECRTRQKLALRAGSTEVFLQPEYYGSEMILEYTDLKLNIDFTDSEKSTLLKSGVPRSLATSDYRNWGGITPKKLFIHGVICGSSKSNIRRFIALGAYGAREKMFHNQLTTLHLLFERGFYTPMTSCSWIHTDKMTPKMLKERMARLQFLRVETKTGKKFFPYAVVGLELYDCIEQAKQLRK